MNKNVDELFGNDTFIDHIIDKGAIYGWSFHYIPIGKDTNFDMMITPKQREMLNHFSWLISGMTEHFPEAVLPEVEDTSTSMPKEM